MSSEPVVCRSLRSAFALLFVIALAVVLRVGVLAKYRAQLDEDPDHYRAIAVQLASGNGYSNPQTGRPTAYRPPLYPLLLGLIIRCGGPHLAIGIVQAILGTATVVLTMDAGRRLGLGRGALVAGALVAVDPLSLYATGQVMTETLAATLAALCLWLCLIPCARGKILLIGMAVGAASLCRPAFLVFGLLAGLLWIALQTRSIDWRAGVRDRGLRTAFIAVAGMLAVLSPWAYRNYSLLGRAVVTTTHGGYTLLLPHNPEYTHDVVNQPWGTVWSSPSFDAWSSGLEAEMAALEPPLDAAHLDPTVEVARDDWMNRQAWEYIRGDPVTAAKSGTTLLFRLWSVIPAATEDSARPVSVRLAIGAFYAPVLMAMLLGIRQALRCGNPDWRPALLLIAAFTGVHSLYWADMRMRTPLVPAIALLAAASLFASSQVRSHKS